MAAYDRFVMPFSQWIDGNGRPLAGGKLYFYASGTDTPLDTYTDEDRTTPNANPVVADGDGVWPSIFLASDVDYKVVLKDSSDATIKTADPVATISSGAQAPRKVTGTGIVTVTLADAGIYLRKTNPSETIINLPSTALRQRQPLEISSLSISLLQEHVIKIYAADGDTIMDLDHWELIEQPGGGGTVLKIRPYPADNTWGLAL